MKWRRVLNVICDAVSEMCRAHRLDDALNVLLKHVVEISHIEHACVFMLSQDHNCFELRATTIDMTRYGILDLRDVTVPLDDPAFGTCLTSEQFTKLEIPSECSNGEMQCSTALKEWCERIGVRALMLFPLKADGEWAGVLCITTTAPDGEFPESTIEAISALTKFAIPALQILHLRATISGIEEKYRALVDSVPAIVWEARFPDLRVTFISGHSERIHGHTLDDYLSDPQFFFKNLHPDDEPVVWSAIQRGLETGDVEVVEYRYRDKWGRWRWVRNVGRVIFDEHGHPKLLRGIATDITEERQREIERRRLERMRALGQIASSVAHDIKNLLAAITGQVELLLYEVRDEHIRSALQTILTCTSDITAIVERMRSLYKMRAGEAERTAVNVRRALEDALAVSEFQRRTLMKKLHKPLEIRANLETTPPVLGIEEELREVFINLILNGLEAMPEGGTLTVRLWSELGQVCISVCDTGIGMDEETRKHIFEAFFTTKGEEGSGLGLHITHDIITRHGGSIEVHSAPGKGSTFIVRLPAMKQTAHRPTKGEPRAQHMPRVLLVEDNLIVRDVLRRMLIRLGYAPSEVATSLDGLQRIAEEHFDLVLANIRGADYDGWQLANRIAELQPHSPVILMASWEDSWDS
ncbi:MAG TPA: response regulator, partial [Armatimonadetes bacterium]|nr:response regulator [Armatimonadota bacterium]